MRAAMEADLAAAHKSRKMFLGYMALAGLAYALVAGWDWVLNPMAYLVPSAYSLTGLAALTILANLVTAATFLQGDELAGAGRVRTLAGISWLSSIVGLAASLTAGTTGAFARPLAGLVGAVTRYLAQARTLVHAYAEEPDRDTDHSEH